MEYLARTLGISPETLGAALSKSDYRQQASPFDHMTGDDLDAWRALGEEDQALATVSFIRAIYHWKRKREYPPSNGKFDPPPTFMPPA